jgi:choline dehydrogenase-like flavoprotein
VRWVVVGAGAAGCVVAGRLAEAGEEVAVIEAGPATVSEGQRGASFFDALAVPERIFPGPFLRGRGVGGSSAVNGMIAVPGDAEQYASWGWTDVASARDAVRVPMVPATDDELGPIDRALLAAAGDAERPALTRRARQRVTAWDAYLGAGAPPLLGPVDLWAGAPAAAVRFDGDVATGVELADGAIVDGDVVVLCAGAIGTPLLLRASGVDLPGVGAHLRNHAALVVRLRLRPDVPGDPHGLVSGVLLRRDDVQLLAVNHHGPTDPATAGLLVADLASTGVGRVTEDGAVEQVVSDVDHRRLVAGVELALQVLAHPAFAELVADVKVGAAPEGVYHPTSTCRMGDVVDADGAVVGRRRLHVADASIFPDLPTANPYLPTLELAERMVPRIRRRAGSW